MGKAVAEAIGGSKRAAKRAALAAEIRQVTDLVKDDAQGVVGMRMDGRTLKRLAIHKRWPDRQSYAKVIVWLLDEWERIHPESVK